jgi:O-antigen/teichoic acid export membrane protein
MTTRDNNKRIAKNTLMLYGRMLLGMAVSLYTSRVVLATLGVENFGIYNVVGGVIVLFSFLDSAMSSATQRFLNYEIGRNDVEQTRRVFSMSLTIYFCIAAAVLFLAETVGLWFLNTQLNIPSVRMNAANWVYQFSVASAIVSILRVPYNATIIAYEKMSIYAYLSVAEVMLRLGIVYLLVLASTDKLILYSGLLFCLTIIMQLASVTYCRKAFESAQYKLYYDSKLFKELIGFSSWSLFGSVAVICNTQGTNMLMNIFCGVTVNAAMGVANQVNGAVYQFVTNFQTAFNPQIVKYYAAQRKEEMTLLVFRASKISFILMLFISLPIIVNINFILAHWLKVVPEYAAGFVCLTLGYCLVDSLSIPIYTLVNATGKIQLYQIIISSVFLLNVPLVYGILYLGFSPVWALVARIGISLLLMPVRLLIAKKQAGIPIWNYVVQVVCRVMPVFMVSVIPAFILTRCLSGWTAFLVSTLYSSMSILLSGWFFGLSGRERGALNSLVDARWRGFMLVNV